MAAAADPGFDPAAIAVTAVEDGLEIGAPGRPLVVVYPADARLEEVQPHVLATAIQSRLARAIADYRAARTPEGLRRAVWHAVLWTVAYAVAIAALVMAWRAARAVTDRHVAARIALGGAGAQRRAADGALGHGPRGAQIGFIAVGLLATYVWLDAVLLALPWTREAGSAALALVSSPILRLAGGLVAAIPQLIALALVVVLTVAALRICARFFALVAAGTLRLSEYDPEWAVPTQRLVRLAIILAGAIMAYPYVPGSSDRGLPGDRPLRRRGVLARSELDRGEPGCRAVTDLPPRLPGRRPGDHRRRDRRRGGAERPGHFHPHLEERAGDDPECDLLSSQVTNYSHFARDQGLILHTEVGIGYEVAWKDVEEMLLEAARRTPGALREPPAFVLQKALADFSPVYEVNVHVRDPQTMPATYSALHASIQDVFAERGVQIMTPHYVADPKAEKIPPVSGAM